MLSFLRNSKNCANASETADLQEKESTHTKFDCCHFFHINRRVFELIPPFSSCFCEDEDHLKHVQSEKLIPTQKTKFYFSSFDHISSQIHSALFEHTDNNDIFIQEMHVSALPQNNVQTCMIIFAESSFNVAVLVPVFFILTFSLQVRWNILICRRVVNIFISLHVCVCVRTVSLILAVTGISPPLSLPFSLSFSPSLLHHFLLLSLSTLNIYFFHAGLRVVC